MPSPPWSKFAIIGPSPNRSSPARSYAPLTVVSHVAHVPAAIRIVEDRKLRADLICDESILKTGRTRVVWLSPNDWHHEGFRYGNIRFQYEWKPLIESKHYYWVESIAYGIEACRILVTSQDYKTLEPYDPLAQDGPWAATKNGDHYWNGNYCLELMIEDDLLLNEATTVDFVTHHPRFCCIDANSCKYKGLIGQRGGREFLTALVARSARVRLPGFVIDGNKGREAAPHVWAAVTMILGRCNPSVTPQWQGLESTHKDAGPVARGLLSAWASDLDAEAMSLLSLFKSATNAQESVAHVMADALGLPGPEQFLE